MSVFTSAVGLGVEALIRYAAYSSRGGRLVLRSGRGMHSGASFVLVSSHRVAGSEVLRWRATLYTTRGPATYTESLVLDRLIRWAVRLGYIYVSAEVFDPAAGQIVLNPREERELYLQYLMELTPPVSEVSSFWMAEPGMWLWARAVVLPVSLETPVHALYQHGQGVDERYLCATRAVAVATAMAFGHTCLTTEVAAVRDHRPSSG